MIGNRQKKDSNGHSYTHIIWIRCIISRDFICWFQMSFESTTTKKSIQHNVESNEINWNTVKIARRSALDIHLQNSNISSQMSVNESFRFGPLWSYMTHPLILQTTTIRKSWWAEIFMQWNKKPNNNVSWLNLSSH